MTTESVSEQVGVTERRKKKRGKRAARRMQIARAEDNAALVGQAAQMIPDSASSVAQAKYLARVVPTISIDKPSDGRQARGSGMGGKRKKSCTPDSAGRSKPIQTP